MTLQEFLVWASGVGNMVISSWILERIPQYQSLESKMKEYVFYGFSVLLGIGAWAVNTYVPAETLNSLAPVFAVFYTTFIGIFVGQYFHAWDKKFTRKG